MEIVSPTKFSTEMHRTIERVDSRGGHTRLRIEDTHEGQTIYVGLDDDSRDALITLLTGGELKTPVTFKNGDIVRFDPSKSKDNFTWAGPVAQKDALAVVTQDYNGRGPWVRIRWICARSKTQRHGGYDPECFEVVSENALTALDRESILRRALDMPV